MRRTFFAPAVVGLVLLATAACRPTQNEIATHAAPNAGQPADETAPQAARFAGYEVIVDTTPKTQWPAAEAAVLSNVRQLTNQDMGITKGGEAYFSPDMKRIIFQAWPKGESAYQMYTLELLPDGTARRDSLKMVSPGGGACTCGYFRPDGKGILYGSTYLNPDMPNPYSAGYKRETGRYRWDMPGGMDIFEAALDGSRLRRLTNIQGYDAECAYDSTGRFIVFSSDRDGDPDIYVMNADGTGVRQVTDAPGYDGGPFFSPDGTRIAFRSDRHENNYLQLFVINVDGTGERQVTRHGPIVNWAPFWHPAGRSVVFATSVHGHRNYEVYMMNVDTGKIQRVTYSPRFDGLPVFSPDGKKMMWTTQRGPSGMSQVFLADFHLPGGF